MKMIFLTALYVAAFAIGRLQAQPLQPYDVIIDEIMADPSPSAGLPEAEWIEIRNRSVLPVNLAGWKLAKVSSLSGPFPDYVLQPDSLLIICGRSSETALQAFGATLSVTSFPALSNTGDGISLLSASGQTIHSVAYTDNWYRNELKKQGGWSLEMIDVSSPCQGSDNWMASTDPLGGSPGKLNTVSALNPDITAPRVLRAYPTDSLRIVLSCSETLDSLQSVNPSQYVIDPGGIIPDSVLVLPPMFDKVVLRLQTPLQRGPIYAIRIRELADCSGNRAGAEQSVRAALPEPVEAANLLINEILFNPYPDGNDYVEIYHAGNRAVNLRDLYIANRDDMGLINDIYNLSVEDRLFFPGDFVVITEDRNKVLNHYVCINPDAMLELSSVPSFADDDGSVLLLNRAGEVLDELKYLNDWHHPLLTNEEGVALERIAYDQPTRQADNWTSASSGVGYGTPTAVNSQHLEPGAMQGDMYAEPRLFSPDMDGRDDFTMLRYHLPNPGFIANISIYDPSGRMVRALQRSALCATEGSFRWDGLDERGRQLPTGIYVIVAELFSTKGKKIRHKLPVVVARNT